MADTKQKKILVVDDEADVRSFLATFLTDQGYEVRTASDGDEGMRLLAEEVPDLVTLDLQMPNETGTQMYRRMHKDAAYRAIPVIVISGVAGRHLAVREPLAVLDKPIDQEALLEVVRSAIG